MCIFGMSCKKLLECGDDDSSSFFLEARNRVKLVDLSIKYIKYLVSPLGYFHTARAGGIAGLHQSCEECHVSNHGLGIFDSKTRFAKKLSNRCGYVVG